MKNKSNRKIICYWELSEAWQEKALSSLFQEDAENAWYLEPTTEEDKDPVNNVLWNLTECKVKIRAGGCNASIAIDENQHLALNISADQKSAVCWIIKKGRLL